MESIEKALQGNSPVMNMLLGENNTGHLSATIDLNLDSTPTHNTLIQSKSSVIRLSQGIEDTKSEWASLRSSLRPATGDWVQPREEILDSLAKHGQGSLEIIDITATNRLLEEQDESNELLELLNEATSYLKEEIGAIKGELSKIHHYNGAIQSLSENSGVSEGGFANIGQKFDDNVWVIGQIATKKEDKIDSMQVVEARNEDFSEDRLLRRAVVSLALLCVITFGTIIYRIMG